MLISMNINNEISFAGKCFLSSKNSINERFVALNIVLYLDQFNQLIIHSLGALMKYFHPSVLF